MMTEEAPLFISPCTTGKEGWFKKTSLGINKLYNILNEMKSDAAMDDSRIKPYKYIIVLEICLYLRWKTCIGLWIIVASDFIIAK